MVIIVDWEQEAEVVDAAAARDECEDDGVEDDAFAGTITPFSTALACYRESLPTYPRSTC